MGHSEAGMTSLALSCVGVRAGLLYPSTVPPLDVGLLGRGNGLIQVTFFGRSSFQRRLTAESHLPAVLLEAAGTSSSVTKWDPRSTPQHPPYY